MALVLKDRVKETSVSTGTGDIVLAGASGAYQAFSTIGNGNTTYYAIAGQTTTEWEVGIGTYVSSGNKITRDTILSSSNSNTIVTFSAGTKDVFITYPSEKGVWVDASGTSNYAATIGSTAVNLGATVSTLAGLTSVTVTQDPSVALDLATKQYVDTLVSSGITYHAPVKYEVPDTTGNLTATYNNGTAGVGATLTNAGTQVAFAPDGPTASIGDRILVYNQTNAFQNGVYEVTTVGSGSTNWVLTRTTDADSYGLKDPNALGNGDAFFVSSGNTGAGETYVCNTPGVITFGTTNITFAQISATQIYSAGTGLTLSGTQFSITNTAVTAATKGTASKTVTATVNAQGQLTSLTDQDIAIAMSQVTSGTLGATQGGTGQSAYAVGDLLYANTTTTLAKLADVATGNALISGGVSTAPAWGKIGLTTHVSGTLPIANGGTNSTATPTAGGVAYGTGTAYAVNTAGTSGQYLTSGGAGAPTWTTLPTNVASISFGTTGLTPSTATTGAVTVAGTLALANGGTGVTTAQAAMNTFAGATTSGQYLRGNGTNVVMASIVAGDVPTLNQNTTGTASNVTGTVAVLNGGTGSTTNSGARTNLGATTVGSNFFTLTNPTAVTFPRINADNTVSTLDAATFRTAIGAGTSSTTGTVTSVAFSTGTTGLSVSGSPITTSGTITLAGTLAIANGGTNSTATATNGGVGYGTGTAHAYTAAGTAGQAIVSNGAAAPTWQELTLANLPGAWTKKAVLAATTANITLSAPQTIDGVACVAGDRVLVKNQTTTSQNGIYVVAAGAWTRATDADASGEIAGGTVSVDAGTVNGGGLFTTLFKSTDVVGTTAMLWYNVVDTSFAVTAGSTKTSSYVNYNGTTAAAGNFDGGTTTPTGATRLNYGGYIYPTYINLVGSADTATAATHYFVETGTDGYVRPKTLANVKTELNVNTTSDLQIDSLGVGTAASGVSGEIRATNNVTAYYVSDIKFKTNVVTIESALDKVVAIGGKEFDWTDEYIADHGGEDGYFVRKHDFGVIAQDVQAVFPLATRTKPDGTLAVDYEKMCALAFQAIAELKAEIDALKKAK